MPEMPEFSRRFALRRLGATGSVEETVTASTTECARLSGRFGLAGIGSLSCRFRLTPGESHTILAEGWLTAQVTQTSVISGEAFDDVVADTFVVRLVPAAQVAMDDGIDLDAPDILPYEGDALDLGDLASEQFALALDPYPRRPGEGFEHAVDVVPPDDAPAADEATDARPNPFAALAARRNDGH